MGGLSIFCSLPFCCDCSPSPNTFLATKLNIWGILVISLSKALSRDCSPASFPTAETPNPNAAAPIGKAFRKKVSLIGLTTFKPIALLRKLLINTLVSMTTAAIAAGRLTKANVPMLALSPSNPVFITDSPNCAAGAAAPAPISEICLKLPLSVLSSLISVGLVASSP